MNAHDLMDMIGDAKGEYLLETQCRREGLPKNKSLKSKNRFISYRIAAVIALVLACIMFLQTPIGAAAVETVKKQVSQLIDILFPPRDIIVMPEGTPEVIPHEAQGREPEEEMPGFVMYVDTESYVMTEKNGVYYVRQIPMEYDREEIRVQQAAVLEGLSPEEQETAIDQRIQELKDFYASLPACEIEISEIDDKDFEAYAEETRNQMAKSWDVVSDVHWTDKPIGFAFTAADGIDWNSPYENHYFIDNGAKGTFHIISRYYSEAGEGHGTRFTAMIQTFTVVMKEETAQYAGTGTAVLENMRQLVNSAKEKNDALLLAAEQDTNSQADIDAFAQERYELWLYTMDDLWPALEQSLDAETMQNLMALQLEWSAYKIAQQDLAAAKGGGSSTFFNSGADMLEQRVYALLNTLEGTAPVFPRDPATQLSPEVVISQFMEAYFSGDREIIKQYLTEPYNWDVDVYTDYETVDPVINAIKGLDTLVLDMANWGEIHASVEFRETPDSDCFIYLSMELNWEDGQWKVSGYGLEG